MAPFHQNQVCKQTPAEDVVALKRQSETTAQPVNTGGYFFLQPTASPSVNKDRMHSPWWMKKERRYCLYQAICIQP